jgi:methyl-accepting chemotaxis protein
LVRIKGDLTVKIASTSRDEVGEVARAFGGMVDSLAGAVKEVSNASIVLKGYNPRHGG